MKPPAATETARTVTHGADVLGPPALSGQRGQRSRPTGLPGQRGRRSRPTGLPDQRGRHSRPTGLPDKRGQRSRPTGLPGQRRHRDARFGNGGGRCGPGGRPRLDIGGGPAPWGPGLGLIGMVNHVHELGQSQVVFSAAQLVDRRPTASPGPAVAPAAVGRVAPPEPAAPPFLTWSVDRATSSSRGMEPVRPRRDLRVVT
jgi:hypothetical protein